MSQRKISAGKPDSLYLCAPVNALVEGIYEERIPLQEIKSMRNTFGLFSWYAHLLANPGTNSQENSLKTLLLEALKGFDLAIGLYLNSDALYPFDLAVQNLLGQAIPGYTHPHHAPGLRQRLEYGYGMAELYQVVSRGKPGWP